MAATELLTATVEKGTVDRIDAEIARRGEDNRSAFVRAAVESHLETTPGVIPVQGVGEVIRAESVALRGFIQLVAISHPEEARKLVRIAIEVLSTGIEGALPRKRVT